MKLKHLFLIALFLVGIMVVIDSSYKLWHAIYPDPKPGEVWSYTDTNPFVTNVSVIKILAVQNGYVQYRHTGWLSECVNTLGYVRSVYHRDDQLCLRAKLEQAELDRLAAEASEISREKQRLAPVVDRLTEIERKLAEIRDRLPAPQPQHQTNIIIETPIWITNTIPTNIYWRNYVDCTNASINVYRHD